MKVRYNGPYDAIELDVPGLPNLVTVGQELDVDDDVAAGLLAGSFEPAPGYETPPPPPEPEVTSQPESSPLD